MAQPNSEIKTRRRDDYPIVFVNGSYETVPAYAIMQVDAVEGVPIDQARLVTIVKPDTTDGVYIVNGPLAVRVGKQGRGRMASPMAIACSGSPVTGDAVGPSAESWLVSTSGTGYIAMGGAENGVVLCRDATGNSSQIKWGEATSSISAMSAWGSFGSGTVQFKNSDGSDDGSEVTVENWFPTTFPSGAGMCCDVSFDPPRVVSGSCE